MSPEVNINTGMISWAINRAGFDMQEILQKIPNVKAWMEGKKKPTVKQLETFSKKVYLPFGYFFLPEPPQETLPIPFFRTLKNSTADISINVYDTILLLQQRQNWLSDYLRDNEYEPLSFVGKFSNRNHILNIVNDIRKTLGLTPDWASRYDTWEDALNNLIKKIEESGIIIVFNGVVENNTHRPIPVEDCRGFVLVDDYAPFLFVNNSDGKAAQMFTIVHELAHVWTGQSAGFDFRKLQPANEPIELLCDKVAAEFLVPETLFKSVWEKEPKIKFLSRYFKVSEIVVARRALDIGVITRKEFFEFYNEYSRREFSEKENQSSGGDFYATAKKRLSLTFAGHILNAVKSGQLLYRDAYKLTGLKGDTFQTFFTKHF